MAVQQRVALVRAGEGVEDLPACDRGAQRDQAAGQELGVDPDVRVDIQERRGGAAAQPVEAGEDLVEDDGQAGPGGGRLGGGRVRGEEGGRGADCVGEGALEERVAGLLAW